MKSAEEKRWQIGHVTIFERHKLLCLIGHVYYNLTVHFFFLPVRNVIWKLYSYKYRL